MKYVFIFLMFFSFVFASTTSTSESSLKNQLTCTNLDADADPSECQKANTLFLSFRMIVVILIGFWGTMVFIDKQTKEDLAKKFFSTLGLFALATIIYFLPYFLEMYFSITISYQEIK